MVCGTPHVSDIQLVRSTHLFRFVDILSRSISQGPCGRIRAQGLPFRPGPLGPWGIFMKKHHKDPGGATVALPSKAYWLL